MGGKASRVDDSIVRFSELEGGDEQGDNVGAGTAQAYNDFMEFVSTV